MHVPPGDCEVEFVPEGLARSIVEAPRHVLLNRPRRQYAFSCAQDTPAGLPGFISFSKVGLAIIRSHTLALPVNVA